MSSAEVDLAQDECDTLAPDTQKDGGAAGDVFLEAPERPNDFNHNNIMAEGLLLQEKRSTSRRCGESSVATTPSAMGRGAQRSAALLDAEELQRDECEENEDAWKTKSVKANEARGDKNGGTCGGQEGAPNVQCDAHARGASIAPAAVAERGRGGEQEPREEVLQNGWAKVPPPRADESHARGLDGAAAPSSLACAHGEGESEVPGGSPRGLRVAARARAARDKEKNNILSVETRRPRGDCGRACGLDGAAANSGLAFAHGEGTSGAPRGSPSDRRAAENGQATRGEEKGSNANVEMLRPRAEGRGRTLGGGGAAPDGLPRAHGGGANSVPRDPLRSGGGVERALAARDEEKGARVEPASGGGARRPPLLGAAAQGRRGAP